MTFEELQREIRDFGLNDFDRDEVAYRVAAAIRAAATAGPTPMGSPDGEHFVVFDDADEAALAALRGEP